MNGLARAMTKASYRRTYEWLVEQVPEGMRLHHILPQAFEDYFLRRGIGNINSPFLLQEVEAGLHARISYAYNTLWRTWIPDHQTATIDEILARARDFMVQVGLDPPW
jgi:hypothetical protein